MPAVSVRKPVLLSPRQRLEPVLLRHNDNSVQYKHPGQKEDREKTPTNLLVCGRQVAPSTKLHTEKDRRQQREDNLRPQPILAVLAKNGLGLTTLGHTPRALPG